MTPDASKLSSADINAEIESLKLALDREAIYGDTLSVAGRMQGFGPIPSWQMLPFDKMQDYYAWRGCIRS